MSPTTPFDHHQLSHLQGVIGTPAGIHQDGNSITLDLVRSDARSIQVTDHNDGTYHVAIIGDNPTYREDLKADDAANAVTLAVKHSPFTPWSTFSYFTGWRFKVDGYSADRDELPRELSGIVRLNRRATIIPIPTFQEWNERKLSKAQDQLFDACSFQPGVQPDHQASKIIVEATVYTPDGHANGVREQIVSARDGQEHVISHDDGRSWEPMHTNLAFSAYHNRWTQGITLKWEEDGSITETDEVYGSLTLHTDGTITIEGTAPSWGLQNRRGHIPSRDFTRTFDSLKEMNKATGWAPADVQQWPGGLVLLND